jgi:hypothetical protein
LLDIDRWLLENKDATVDDYLVALVDDERKWKSEHGGIGIDDHFLSYIPILEEIYYLKHNKLVDYLGLRGSGHGLVQEDIYEILLKIIETGDSFLNGYLEYVNGGNQK